MWNLNWLRWLGILGILLWIFGAASGCGTDKSMTDKQIEKDIEVKMTWLTKIAQIAEAQGISWHADLDVSGRPSIGETVDLYFDTGVSLSMHFQGNAQKEPKKQ